MNKRGNEVTMRERGEIEGDIKKDGKKTTIKIYNGLKSRGDTEEKTGNKR